MTTERASTFGEILQRHRVAAGLTQEDLAERAGLSARGISDLERGARARPHLATVRQIATALQLSDRDREELQRAARGQMDSAQSDSVSAGVRTFLLADVRGYTHYALEHGDEAAARLLTRFGELVAENIAAWDGRLTELRGDEALAVFVSPRQALLSAVDLQARLRDENERFPLGVGIGLDAGEPVVVGGGYRETALNLASRLCGIAEAGEVLVSEGLIHLARKVDGLVYRARPRVQLEGFGDTVTVIEVTAALDSSPAFTAEPATEERQSLPIGGFLGSLPPGSLVGRETELGRVQTALEAVEAGQGRLILLAGEPGIGKTRLAQELTHIAHERGFLVAAGRCYEPQQSVPYYPFLDALSMAYAAAPAATRDQASNRWPYLARLLPDQLNSPAVPPSESSEEQGRLLRAVSAFLLALAEIRPVVLLLDDLHWADSASLQLLQHLSRQTRGGRVLIVGTYRDVEVHPHHPLEATLRDLNREQVIERVILRRLGERETSTLMSESMEHFHVEPDLAALVYQHTGGNPFFTHQVLQALVENGSIYREDGQWKQRAIHEIEVPESVRSVIAQRISHLKLEAQEVLQEASILGPEFNFDDLLEMKLTRHDADLEDVLDGALADAVSIGLVLLTGKERYAFDHALTQHALYTMLSPRRRRRLHLAAGGAIERLPMRVRNQRAAELAWHFLQGDDGEKAIQYSILAGDQAESVFAHAEGEHQYRVALGLARETGDQVAEADATEKIGVVLKIIGRYDEARDMLEQAAEMRRAMKDLEGEGRVVSQIGLLYHLTGEPEDGIRRLLPLAEKLEPLGPSLSLAQLTSALVRLYDHSGRQRDQLDASRQLMELARGLGDECLLAEAELHQGVSLMHVGRYDDALRLLQSALDRAERLGDLYTAATALRFRALVYHGRHEVEQARLSHERAVEVAERLGDPLNVSQRSVETAYFHFLIGNWTRSREYAERAVKSALEIDNLRAFVQPLFTLGELSVYTGSWEDANGYLRECITIAQHLQLVDHLREVQAVLAEKDLLEGNPQLALDRLRPLLDTPGWREHLNFLLVLGSARLAAGDLGGAEEAIGKAMADTTSQRLPLGMVDGLRVMGSIAGRRGAWEEAERRLLHAVQLGQEITYPWGEARAHFEAGLVFALQGKISQAVQQFESAAATFAVLGAEPYRIRVTQELAAIGR